MRKRSKFHYAFMFLIPLTGWSCGQLCNACPDGVSVTDQASVKVTPDQASLVFSVESTNDDVDVAVQKNTESVDRLKAYLKNEKVKSIESDTPIIEARYSPNYSGSSVNKTMNGYLVRTTVSGTLAETKQFKTVSAGALTHGASTVLAAQLKSTRIDEIRDQARKLALEKAKTKATALARQVGQTPGLITNVEEVSPAQSWSTFAAVSSQRWDTFPPLGLLTNTYTGYGTVSPADLSIESNKIIVTSVMKICMEFKELVAREKHETVR